MSRFIRLPDGERVLVGGTDKEKEIEADRSKAAPILREMEKLKEKRTREAEPDEGPVRQEKTATDEGKAEEKRS